MKIKERLADIQHRLIAPKGQYNSFSKFHYRSCEDILEALKPILDTASLILSDEIVSVGDRIYVKATVTLIDDGEISSTGFAREPLDRKGMDESQITGSASSYARKYALNGLFCIDDTKDADTMNNRGNGDLDASILKDIAKAISVDELRAIWEGRCNSDTRYSAAVNKRKAEL